MTWDFHFPLVESKKPFLHASIRLAVPGTKLASVDVTEQVIHCVAVLGTNCLIHRSSFLNSTPLGIFIQISHCSPAQPHGICLPLVE